MNRSKIVKDTGTLFATNIITKIIGFIISIIIARFLGASDFGVYSFAIAFTSLFAILSDFGMKVLIRREIARNKYRTNTLLMDTITSKIVLSLASIIFIVLFVKYTGQDIDRQIIIIVTAIATLVLSFTESMYSIFQAHEKMQYGAILSVLRNILRFIITYILLVSGFGLISVIVIMLLVRILELITSFIIYSRKIAKIEWNIDFKRSKKTLIHSIPFGVAAVFILIYYKIDIVMLSFMTNDAMVGSYSAAYNLIEGLLFLPLAFSTAITPLASRLYAESVTKLRNLFTESLRLLILISVPIAVGISILADKIIILIYGNEYSGSILALRILVWSIIPTFLHYITGLFIVSTNNEKSGAVITGICALFNIGINFILIPRYGIIGAAISTILTELLLLVMSYVILRKVFNGINILKNAYKPFIAGIIMSTIYFISDWNILLTICIGTIMYFGSIYLLKGFEKTDIKIIQSILRIK